MAGLPELRDLRVFLALVEELHFGRTAERLDISQARVSQTLSRLERRYRVRLFDRTSRRVTLTDDGARLRDLLAEPYAELVHILENARDELATTLTGEMRLGLHPFMAGGPLLDPILARFAELYPACEVRVVEAPLATPLAPLLDRSVDVVASRTAPPDPRVRVGPVLSEDQRLLAVADDHPLAARSEVTTDDVADYPVSSADGWTPEQDAAYFPLASTSGRPIRREYRATSLPDALAAAAAGLTVHPTVASLADYYQTRGLTMVPITDASPSRSFLLTLAQRPSRRALAFLGCASDVLGTR